jgi:hypothetical protein
MIGPHLTPENHAAVLARAKFRTKKELTKLVRELNPLPQVPDRIEPLGPALAPNPTMNPSWEEVVAALSPAVRQLPPGERPADWANDGVDGVDDSGVVGEKLAATGELSGDEGPDGELLPVGPLPSDLPPVTGAQFFQLQFGTSEEHVQLIERARALLARTRPQLTLGELHLEAMKLLVATLEKRTLGEGDGSGKRAKARLPPPQAPRQRVDSSETSEPAEAPRQRVASAETSEPAEAPRQRVASAETSEPAEAPRQRVASSETSEPAEAPRQRVDSARIDEASEGEARLRGRYVPAAVRREVYRRDGARCTYVDARGQRCSERHYLELHHLQPFARGGAHVASNLSLRCVAHNALAAEQDFGSELMAQRRSSTRHQTLMAQMQGKKRRSE